MALIVVALEFYFFNDSHAFVLELLIICVLLLPVYVLAINNQAQLGGNLFTVILTIACLYMMWSAEGARDEVVLALPSILTFAILLGSARTFFIQLVFIVINLLLLGYLNDIGYVRHEVSDNNVHSSFIVIVMLLVTTYAIWLIAQDLIRALANLAKENRRVVQSQHEIEKLVHYDALTGLPNRILAKMKFDYAQELMLRHQGKMCLMFIDLDNFKYINDTFGHQVGDRYLMKLAMQLKQVCRQSDVISRLGGDEFLLLLAELDHYEQATVVAQKLLSCVSQPIEIDGNSISSTCSIGLAFAPEHGTSFDELCQKADLAMYQSKRKGKNEYDIFSDDLKASHAESLLLTTELRKAIDAEQLEIYYQPQIRLSDNKIVAAEALLRWNHPSLGQVSPLSFIPVAENSGQIIAIGEWVITQVTRQIAAWRKAVDQNFRIAINISPLQFRRGTLCDFLSQALKQHQLPGSCLELEFTESLLIDNPAAVMDELRSIKAAGTALSIDDFGTGYSSLSYLQSLDIESLKIDRTFVSHMASNEKNLGIVRAIIHMAKELELLTIAEGVEDQATLDLLRELGCDLAQGFFWAKPLPLAEFEDFVSAYRTGMAEVYQS